MAAAYEYEPSATLWYPVLRHPDRPIVHLVSCRIQSAQKVTEGLTVTVQLLQPRNVLHKYDIWSATLHQISKVTKQRDALIMIELRPLRDLLSERLAWCTSAKQHRVWSFPVYPESDCINAYVADIRKLKVDIWEVGFEGLPSVRVVIQRERNLHASGLKAVACTAATDEEVIHPNCHWNITLEHAYTLKPSYPVFAAHKSDSNPALRLDVR